MAEQLKVPNPDINERKRLVLLSMLDTPNAVEAMARGAGLTVDEVKGIMCRLIDEFGGAERH